MKVISILQVVALITLFSALVILYYDAFDLIADPKFDKTYTAVNFGGLPYFFGVSCFAFEGSGLTIDIYNSL